MTIKLAFIFTCVERTFELFLDFEYLQQHEGLLCISHYWNVLRRYQNRDPLSLQRMLV
jgi:hypothetical protein